MGHFSSFPRVFQVTSGHQDEMDLKDTRLADNVGNIYIQFEKRRGSALTRIVYRESKEQEVFQGPEEQSDFRWVWPQCVHRLSQSAKVKASWAVCRQGDEGPVGPVGSAGHEVSSE